MGVIKDIFTSKQNRSNPVEVDLDNLFEEFYERLVYFSSQFVKDDHQAQDIAQDAFIKYWHVQHTVAKDKTAIKNFLYSAVRNASLNVIRHDKVVEGYNLLQGTSEPGEQSVMEAIITAEVMADLHAAVQSLPDNYRVVSMLSYMEGKKNHEIADELNMSVNTVKKQKQRALQLLRLKLEPELFILLFASAAVFI